VTELEKAEAALEKAWDQWHSSETWSAWEAVEEAIAARNAAKEKSE